jgi:transposase
MDGASLSSGERCTILTDRDARGPKVAIIAIVEGTGAEEVIQMPDRLPEALPDAVEEVTPDMPDSMRRIIRHCFPKASEGIDRFHVQRPAFDALQEMRISHRRDAINEETDAGENAKPDDRDYIAPPLRGCVKTKINPLRISCYPPGAGICFSSRPKNGRSLKSSVQKYFSGKPPI